MESKTIYFEKAGRDNSDAALMAAKKRADELGIKTVVVATTAGDMGVKAMEIFTGFNVIAVTHSSGFSEPNTLRMTTENKAKIEGKGGKVIIATHPFAGVPRAVRKQLNTYTETEIIANAIRIFGDGMKVVVEIAMMAADSGLARTGEEIICIGGTGRGADTAVVLSPVTSQEFFSLKIKEIICKPRF